MRLDKYRLYCNTEAANVETDYREAVPTVCPNNNQHSIDTDSIAIIATQTDQDPRDQSGKVRYQETSRPLGTDTYFTGQGDDISNVVKVGGGELFVGNHISGLSLASVARADNVATITLNKAHKSIVGDVVCVVCDDTSYSVDEAPVLSVPTDDSFTVANVGSDEAAKSSTGTAVVCTNYRYLDFNIAMNITWLHEGYVIARSADFDRVTFGVVPVVTPILTGQTSTNFNLLGGYLVIPAAGNGTISLVNDMTGPRHGLIYMPNDDQGKPPVAFWNATFNPATKLYENLTAAPLGNGRYNMFAMEVMLKRFVNQIILLGNMPHWMLQTADTAQLGQGMRFKAAMFTNDDDADHDWKFACTMVMHRARTC